MIGNRVVDDYNFVMEFFMNSNFFGGDNYIYS